MVFGLPQIQTMIQPPTVRTTRITAIMMYTVIIVEYASLATCEYSDLKESLESMLSARRPVLIAPVVVRKVCKMQKQSKVS